MAQFSVEITRPPGSVLGGNQQLEPKQSLFHVAANVRLPPTADVERYRMKSLRVVDGLIDKEA
jgi:hypothetical protein